MWRSNWTPDIQPIYDRMNTFPVGSDQPLTAPTVVVASNSSQTRYKNYGFRTNVTLGIIQIVCGVLLMGFSVSIQVRHG